MLLLEKMDTPAALNRSVQFHAALIDDLLEENYKFLFTPRFRSDALETRFGLYRQISDARFLASTK